MWRPIILRTSKPIVESSKRLFTKPVSNKVYSRLRPVVYSNEFSTSSIRFQTNSSVPLGSSKPELPKFDKNKKREKSDETKYSNYFAVFVSGVIAYYGISYYLDYRKNRPQNFEINYTSQHLPGVIKPSKTVRREKNPGNIKLTLYQFTTCPFCCKVRAYLDYFGYSYDIVEVNSLTKKQIDWSPSYKSVPVIGVQIPSKENPNVYESEIIQLNDSSVIISALETYRLDPSHSLREIVRYFEPVEFDAKGNRQSQVDVSNRYFVMLYNDKVVEGKSNSERKLEREWRSWVDSKFVHVISPNCYRTLGEAIDTFRWFEKAGEWEKEFNSFERFCMVYVGSFVMYLISMKLKKKYELKENVRDSFDECSEEWTSTIDSKHIFKGGMKPNLADLALYGSMGSFEGCLAFDDMMKHDKIKAWYLAMKDMVSNSKGVIYLNNDKIKN